MKHIVSNSIHLESDVWRLHGGKDIHYSDGVHHEEYLNNVLTSAKDLSSKSDELTGMAKDWTSEYHLSKKRAQLFSGFNFERASSVLEVGCGCGAITRYLGENFDEVVSVEGTFARAKLARLRTKDLGNVNILNAPFQDLNFTKKFDIVICVGVFEYSSAFIGGEDPHDAALAYFSSLLKPNGSLLIAIENQFGLKYFSSGKEDHTNVMFDGIEGYPRYPDKARTFGKNEITNRIKKHFAGADFYYPYPDYKIPSLIISENAFPKVRVAGLISNFHCPRANEYFDDPLFDESLALSELEENDSLEFFANSFLIVANKGLESSLDFPQLGVFHSNDRIPCYQTKTVIKEVGHDVVVEKLTSNAAKKGAPFKNLSLSVGESTWIQGPSLEHLLYKNSRVIGISLDDLFKPCLLWLSRLNEISSETDVPGHVSGKCIDLIWRNTIINDNKAHFIDEEWSFNSKISINALTIRSIVYFLIKTRNTQDLTKCLRSRSIYSKVWEIADVIGVSLTKRDFEEFYVLEHAMSEVSINKKASFPVASLYLYLRFTSLHEVLAIAYLKGKNFKLNPRILLSRIKGKLVRIVK